MKSQIIFADEKLKAEFEKLKDIKENGLLQTAGKLWKYNLPDAWRLIYTIKSNRIIICSLRMA